MILSAGEAPLLVVGEAGKGRVAVLGVAPLGKAPEGSTALWTAPDWPEQLANIIRWAAAR